METIAVAVISSALTTAFIYWYLHRKNPDLAQTVTDTVKAAATEDVKAAAEVVTDAVKKD